MGIFAFLNRKSAAEWPEHRRAQAVIDFPGGSLNGVRLGAPGESIAMLGRPSNADATRTGDYYYLASGIEIENIDNEVSVFRCIFRDRWSQGHTPCILSLQTGNGSLEIGVRTTAAEVTAFLGAPADIEEKEDVSIHSYDFASHYYEFDFLKDGTLACIHAYLKGE